MDYNLYNVSTVIPVDQKLKRLNLFFNRFDRFVTNLFLHSKFMDLLVLIECIIMSWPHICFLIDSTPKNRNLILWRKKNNCLQWFMKVFQSLRLVWSFFLMIILKKTFLFVRCAISFSSLKDKSLKSINSPRCYPSKGQMRNTYNFYNNNWEFT